jgi:hypothetical protein
MRKKLRNLGLIALVIAAVGTLVVLVVLNRPIDLPKGFETPAIDRPMALFVIDSCVDEFTTRLEIIEKLPDKTSQQNADKWCLLERCKSYRTLCSLRKQDTIYHSFTLKYIAHIRIFEKTQLNKLDSGIKRTQY